MSILIEGSEDFKKKTEEALQLVRKSPEHIGVVEGYIEIIKESTASGMNATLAQPTFLVGKTTSDSGGNWYASCIVHDAFHSKLYNDYKKQNPSKEVPNDVWTGKEAEIKCIDFQIGFLKVINDEKDTLKGLIEHAEKSKTTGYWETPFEKRQY